MIRACLSDITGTYSLTFAIRLVEEAEKLMPNHSALAVANEIIRLRQQSWAPNQTQLQKLVFNSHAWNLAVNSEPLIVEHAQAWENGPVYRSIWNHIRDYGHKGDNCLLVNPTTNQPFKSNFTPAESDVIRRTWEKYGSLNGIELSRMSHEPNSPWERAFFGRGKNSALSDREIRDYYTKLAMAGRV